MSWTDLVSAIIGSGIGTAAVTALFKRREAKLGRRGQKGDEARDRLADLEVCYDDLAHGSDRTDMRALEAKFSAAVDKLVSQDLSSAADAFVTCGRAYASGDVDVGAEKFEAARDEVRDELRSIVKDLS